MKFSQAEFFDTHPALYPWPRFLRKKGFKKVYKPRDAKFKKILDLLGIEKEKKVLDVGCSDGVFLERIARSYQVSGVGVDISPLSIKRAKADSGLAIKFFVADACKLPFAARSFDFVFSFDTLEHIKDKKGAILEMARVLRPGGKLLVYTLNKKQKFTWNWYLNKIGIDIYEGYAHDPKLFLEPEKTKKQLEKTGLIVEKLELFNSFFSLACDEVIMVLVSLLSKSGIFKKETKTSLVFGKMFLGLTDFFSKIFLPFLEVLDRPWTKRGYSNSFFLIARKEKLSPPG